jgi:muramoyltetrapeptide carboxypeptidase
LKAVSDSDPMGVLMSSPWWTEEYFDWSRREDLERPRRRVPSEGWTWLKGDMGEGVLIGGCLESLQHLRGMLVGRPMGYAPAEKEQLRRVILERTAAYAFPVVTDMDFGHTAPQLTLPIGCRAKIDVSRRRIEVLETAVSNTVSG